MRTEILTKKRSITKDQALKKPDSKKVQKSPMKEQRETVVEAFLRNVRVKSFKGTTIPNSKMDTPDTPEDSLMKAPPSR